MRCQRLPTVWLTRATLAEFLRAVSDSAVDPAWHAPSVRHPRPMMWIGLKPP